MRFSGTLQTHGDTEWLKTNLNLVGGRVEITAGDETLGSWPLTQVKAERIEGNRFDLSLGEDRAVFVADDALAFSYEALPRLAKNPIVEAAQGFRQKLKGSARKASKNTSSPSVESEPEAGEGFSTEIEWQQPDPEEAPANVKRLRELIEAARANRAEEPESPESVDVVEPGEPEVAVFSIDPPMMLVEATTEAEPEALWAGSDVGRRIKPRIEEDSRAFTARVEPSNQLELVDELEQLMKRAQSGGLTESQAQAATSLVRSLRALLDS